MWSDSVGRVDSASDYSRSGGHQLSRIDDQMRYLRRLCEAALTVEAKDPDAVRTRIYDLHHELGAQVSRLEDDAAGMSDHLPAQVREVISSFQRLCRLVERATEALSSWGSDWDEDQLDEPRTFRSRPNEQRIQQDLAFPRLLDRHYDGWLRRP